MWIPADVVAGLGELGLSSGLTEGTLAEEMETLMAAVLATLPTTTGVALSIGEQGRRVTVSTESFESGLHKVAVRLRTNEAVLEISSSTRVSPAEHLVGLPVVLDTDSDSVAGSTRSTLADQLGEVSMIDRALGVLLDQGYDGALAGIELRRFAADHHQTLAEAARTIIGLLR